MPAIVIVSPKGGAGKSTAAVLLGTEMAHAGVPVTMMDCDPNRSLTWWSTQSALPDRMRILSEVTEASIVKAVKVHDRQGRLVVMDMEGVASRLVSRAISQADLVITPMRATTLDATVGGRALQLVAEEEEALGRTIVHSVIFPMTRTIPDQAAQPASRHHSKRRGSTSSAPHCSNGLPFRLCSSSAAISGPCQPRAIWKRPSTMRRSSLRPSTAVSQETRNERP